MRISANARSVGPGPEQTQAVARIAPRAHRAAMTVAHTASSSGITFWIRATPGAKREAVGGSHADADALCVAVAAPPVEGRANAACVEALAAAFGVRRAAVALDPASRGRRKRVSIAGEPAALAARLAALAGET